MTQGVIIKDFDPAHRYRYPGRIIKNPRAKLMANYNVIYKEKKELYLKFEQAPEILQYQTKITIKDKGKKPVEIELDFIGIEPMAAPMPPKQYKISRESISDLFPAINKWAKKYGYKIY